MLAALALPRWLERWADRALMVAAAASLSFTLALIAVLQASIGSDYLFATFFVGWFALGFAYSISVTPSGRLLRRSADPEDWPPLFAAQFALCHSCWLLAYPLAGWLGSTFGQFEACAGMALLAGAGATLAWTLWPPPDLAPVSRACTDLP
jgi:hypothetical protein